MARPAFIAALLLPLPFAALPLVAVLLGGPHLGTGEETAYVPVTSTYTDAASPSDHTASYAQTTGAANTADQLTHGCDDFSTES